MGSLLLQQAMNDTTSSRPALVGAVTRVLVATSAHDALCVRQTPLHFA